MVEVARRGRADSIMHPLGFQPLLDQLGYPQLYIQSCNKSVSQPESIPSLRETVSSLTEKYIFPQLSTREIFSMYSIEISNDVSQNNTLFNLIIKSGTQT